MHRAFEQFGLGNLPGLKSLDESENRPVIEGTALDLN
jgi:hypothetical protein